MFFTQKIVKKPHFTVAHTVILKSKSIKKILSVTTRKKFCKSFGFKSKVRLCPRRSKNIFTLSLTQQVLQLRKLRTCIGLIIAILTVNLSTAILRYENLHRFDNRCFNSEFKNRRFKIRRFA